MKYCHLTVNISVFENFSGISSHFVFFFFFLGSGNRGGVRRLSSSPPSLVVRCSNASAAARLEPFCPAFSDEDDVDHAEPRQQHID